MVFGLQRAANAGNLAFSLTSALTATDKAKLVLHVGSSHVRVQRCGLQIVTTTTYGQHRPGLVVDELEVTLRLREAVTSTDATLSGLAVNDGSTDVTLTPTFAPGMYTYTASVASTVAEVTVTPTKNDDGATIEYLDASNMTLTDADTSAPGQQVALAWATTSSR